MEPNNVNWLLWPFHTVSKEGHKVTMDTIDTLIYGAKVVDGTGSPWCYGDVAIHGDLVQEVVPPGCIPLESAREVVDGTGMVVCPGFIDILSQSQLELMHDSRVLSKITQGVTTEITRTNTTDELATFRRLA